jgi:HPt (histidine-containing phosphotransfer) domain-containing protein
MPQELPSEAQGPAIAPGVAPGAAAALARLACCPELDTCQGLRLVRDDAAVYLTFLGRLVAKLDARIPSLQQLQHGGSRTELRLQAHEIRGVAANLGAHRVAAAAEALDTRELDHLDGRTTEALVGSLCKAINALGRCLALAIRGQVPLNGGEAGLDRLDD